MEDFRNYLCDQVTQRAAELLDNNFHVRLNAVIILAQLNLTDEDARKQLPEQAYVKAAIPLLTVIGRLPAVASTSNWKPSKSRRPLGWGGSICSARRGI